MTAPGEWAGVIAAADALAAALDEGRPVRRLARGLLAELAALWTVGGVPTSPGTPPTGPERISTLPAGRPDMAQVWPVKFTGADKQDFTVWLDRCKQAGAARNMTDAIRLAVRLATSIPIEQLPKQKAGH